MTDQIITGEEIYKEIHNTCSVSDEFKPLLNKKYISINNNSNLIQNIEDLKRVILGLRQRQKVLINTHYGKVIKLTEKIKELENDRS